MEILILENTVSSILLSEQCFKSALYVSFFHAFLSAASGIADIEVQMSVRPF